jgi:F-type H+-transporting ATPase subunit gamma
VSERRELEDRLHSLTDISGILGAMKTLALLDIQKLGRFQSTQRRVVTGIERALTDLFTFYPLAVPVPDLTRPVWLLLGSERGFCGEFNRMVVRTFMARREEAGERHVHVVAVGRKLASMLSRHQPLDATLAGPMVAEEVHQVLIAVMDRLREFQRQQTRDCPLDLRILHHRPDAGRSQVCLRTPLRLSPERAHGYGFPPLLNLDPLVLTSELFEHYLFAILHEVFYSSLTAENLFRLQHIDGAIQRLDKHLAELLLRRNVLRQEEITEEIEVIMLSVEALRESLAAGAAARPAPVKTEQIDCR